MKNRSNGKIIFSLLEEVVLVKKNIKLEAAEIFTCPTRMVIAGLVWQHFGISSKN